MPQSSFTILFHGQSKVQHCLGHCASQRNCRTYFDGSGSFGRNLNRSSHAVRSDLVNGIVGSGKHFSRRLGKISGSGRHTSHGQGGRPSPKLAHSGSHCTGRASLAGPGAPRLRSCAMSRQLMAQADAMSFSSLHVATAIGQWWVHRRRRPVIIKDCWQFTALLCLPLVLCDSAVPLLATSHLRGETQPSAINCPKSPCSWSAPLDGSSGHGRNFSAPP